MNNNDNAQSNSIYLIHDLVNKFNISKDAIRLYERKGLLEPARNESGYRVYSDYEVLRLKDILVMKNLGFTLIEIKEALGNNDRKELLRLQLEKIDSNIESLLAKKEIIEILLENNKSDTIPCDEILGTLVRI